MNALKTMAGQLRGGDDSSSGAGVISSAMKTGDPFIYVF